ncbi:MAG: hypothetical protein FWE11_07995 [Defluviitaleaceae bacterium]|nr:hypothetical protein [Defluviitaleaceae bacterium]
MKKKFASLLLVFVFALSVFITAPASSRDCEMEGEILIQLPGHIGTFEFAPIHFPDR